MVGRPRINLVGQKFGRLYVVEKTEEKTKDGLVFYKCLCDCGKKKLICHSNLRSGNTKSCGCLNSENAKKRNIRHGGCINYKRTKEYSTWDSMVRRCSNPKHKSYHNYGGRGIKVCQEWIKFKNFLKCLKDNNMFPKPINMSIDRINNDGNYEPGNIRWATSSQQIRNRRILQ
jgi:hypothetical protein